jgi:hypothetical protein
VLAISPAGRDLASTRTSPTGRGLHRRLGRSTGHPGLASTTPEMSVFEPDGRAGAVPAGRTPHEALTRTRAAAGSNHRACRPGHRIVIISELGRSGEPIGSPRRGGRVVLAAGAPGNLDHSGGSPPSRPGRGQRSGDQGISDDRGQRGWSRVPDSCRCRRAGTPSEPVWRRVRKSGRSGPWSGRGLGSGRAGRLGSRA